MVQHVQKNRASTVINSSLQQGQLKLPNVKRAAVAAELYIVAEES